MGRPNVVTIDASGKRGGAVEASLDAATCSFAAAPAASYEIAFPGSLTLAEHRERELTAAVAAAKLARRPPIPEYPVRAFTSPEGGGKTAGERIIVQAEDFSAQGLGEVRKTDQKVATQNEAFLNWNNPGHWLEWPVKVAQAGVYTITFRYCTQDEGAKRAIVIDEAYPAECCLDVPFPSTGGYSNKHDDWCSLVISDPVTGQAVTAYLDPGIHTLRAYNVSSPVNLDYIVLEPVEND